MIVTAIERQKRDRARVSIFVDGEFALGLGTGTLARSGLRKGDRVDRDLLERLRKEEEESSARAAALRYAGRRRKTEQEIRRKLASLSFTPAAVEAAIDALRASGLADDRAYVRAYVHDAQLRRPAGGRMISARLRGKGIPRDLLREEIEAALGPEEEARLAGRCAEGYLERLAGRRRAGEPLRPSERTALLRRYLAGRGFGPPAIDAALKALPAAAGRRVGD